LGKSAPTTNATLNSQPQTTSDNNLDVQNKNILTISIEDGILLIEIDFESD